MVMSKIIHLPSQFKMIALHGFVAPIVDNNGEPSAETFTFDFGILRFIDGAGLTVLSNTLEWLLFKGVKFDFQNINACDAIAYMDDCGFFKTYSSQSINSCSRPRTTTLPCTKVEHADAHNWLEGQLIPWMSGVFGGNPSRFASIRTCIKEVFNNIQDHSTQNIGCIHAQHYPNAKQVNITVSDFGRGIPSTIKGRYGQMNDGRAILEASKEGVTAQTIPTNRGVGLDFLISNVIANHGKVNIFSLSGGLFCCSNMRQACDYGQGSYPGTLVDILLPTDRFVGDEDTERDFEW